MLHVDFDMYKKAHAKEVARRWHQIYKPKEVSQKFIDGEFLKPHELNQIDVLIEYLV